MNIARIVLNKHSSAVLTRNLRKGIFASQVPVDSPYSDRRSMRAQANQISDHLEEIFLVPIVKSYFSNRTEGSHVPHPEGYK